MSDIFGQTEQRRPVFPAGAFDRHILSVQALPDPDTVDVDTCRFLVQPTENKQSGEIYIVRLVNNVKTWLNIKEFDQEALIWENPKFWKRLTEDAIILHWEDPKSPLWSKTVVVRKRGSVPETLNDGEIVGSSTVRDQYKLGTLGFVHALFPEDTDYYYRLFAVNFAGVATPSTTSVKSSWTWDEIAQTIGDLSIDADLYKYCFRVGDIFPMPENVCCTDGSGNPVQLHARIVDFDTTYSYNDQMKRVRPRSITFMTEEVLGTLSFSNKELEYAKTNDTFFVGDKKYFIKSPLSGEMEEYNWTKLYQRNDAIPGTLPAIDGVGPSTADKLQELHPSIRYFKNISIAGLDEPTKEAQLATHCGCSSWHVSNLHDWLNVDKPGLIPDRYKENEDPVYKWWKEEVDDHQSWLSAVNGWFTASVGAYHHVAPGSLQSGYYIDVPPFVSGFTSEIGQRFLKNLIPASCYTITDQYVHRYNRNASIGDRDKGTIVNKGTDHVGALETPADKFWLPSFEEIFGRRPYYGVNGLINTAEISGTHEGTQFKYFRDNPNWRSCRLKSNLSGDPSGWYLRSCDPTTVGRVYYVSQDLPETDANPQTVETTCTAHRYTIEGSPENLVIGPVVCFALGAAKN